MKRVKLLLAIFVLSGVAGLIYQSIWSHYLGLFLGHAAYAQALVLAIFMGGMAFGSILVSRKTADWSSLIRRYAVIELVIGLVAFCFHFLFEAVLSLSFEKVIPAMEADWLVTMYKWLISAFLILPQTILLGMTFPLMSAGIIRSLGGGHTGRVLGGLYFFNSIGAAIGVLSVAFFIMPQMGLPGALKFAGCVNILVALGAWICGSVEKKPSENTQSSHAVDDGAKDRKLVWFVLIATCVSGAASFAYEIVWIRFLSLAVGSTYHAFELMLAAFIAGIALGGWWIRNRADSSPSPLALAGWIQVCMGLASIASLLLYSFSFSWVEFLVGVLQGTANGYALYNIATAIISILIMMPAAIFAGMTLPLFTHALLKSGEGERVIGRVYAWNTFGAIAGVFASVFLLIPLMGLRLTLIFAALVDILVGFFLLRRFLMRRYKKAKLTGVYLGSTAMLICALYVFPFDVLTLSSGVFRTGVADRSDGVQNVYYKDGKTSTIAVALYDSGIASISTNGKVDASIQAFIEEEITWDEPTMVLTGALPLAYRQDVNRAGVIGFGSGMTTHTLLADPGMEFVDTIEIERAMYEGAKIFGERVSRAYDDPRSQVIFDDAKSYFSSRQYKYDVIVSEPSNPWVSGVGALFTKEFYQLIPRYLSDNGLFVQWIQLYEIDEPLVGSILKALTEGFNDYEAYLANTSDLIIVASRGQLPAVDFAALVNGPLADDLRRVKINDVHDVAFRKLMNRDMLNVLSDLYGEQANSDYFPVLTVEAPRTRFMKVSANQIANLPNLPLPLLEYLGVREPLPAAGIENRVPFSGSVSLTQAAVEVRSHRLGWSGEDVRDVEAVSRMQLLRERLSCKGDISPRVDVLLASELRWLVETSWPFLSSADLEGLLVKPDWIGCKNLPEAIDRAMSLFDSMGSRNHEKTIELAVQWFENDLNADDAFKQELDQVVYAALQLSYIASESYDAALALEDEIGLSVKSEGVYAHARLLAANYADLKSVR